MLAAIAAIVVCLLLPTEWWGGTARAAEASDKEATTLVRAGMEAPDFTVAMIDGSEVTLSKLRGRVVLVNFWATWCPPCRAELARVQRDLIDRFAGKPFTFLPISRGETRETVEAFRAKTGYAFPMGLDPQQTIYGRYAANYIPRNFLIDAEGRCVSAVIGYTPAEFEALTAKIEELLAR